MVDKDSQRIEAWNSDCLPLYEPGLDEILADIRRRPIATGRHQDGPALNLRFSTDIERAIDEADIIVLCIDTPTKSFGIGQGVAADLTNLQAAVKTIARVASTDKIVVEKSTVPCGTAEVIRDLVWCYLSLAILQPTHDVSCTDAPRPMRTSKSSPTPSSCPKAPPSRICCIHRASSSGRNRPRPDTKPPPRSPASTRHGSRGNRSRRWTAGRRSCRSWRPMRCWRSD